MRTLLWILGGVLLGLVIHLGVMLTLPHFATQTAWDRVAVESKWLWGRIFPEDKAAQRP